VLEHELGYWALRTLHKTKHRVNRFEPLDRFSRLLVRRIVLRLRSALLASLLPPSLTLVHTQANQITEVEASRRVVSFRFREPRLGEETLTVICHLFIETTSPAADTLFQRFLQAVRLGEEPADLLDHQSGLVLLSRRVARFGRRTYWVVSIASSEAEKSDASARVPSAEESWTNVRVRTAPILPSDRMLERIGMDATTHQRGRDEESRFDLERLQARADGDWAFVGEAIKQATAEGRALDEAFVETVAQARLAKAQEDYRFAEGPNAGPTLESSRAIVRDIIELHAIATDRLPD
jgi:hypothetical protein